MMVTVGELLDQAQRQSWDLVQSALTTGPSRRAVARDLYRAQLAGWPELARVGARALRATSGGAALPRYKPALDALDVLAASPATTAAATSPFGALCSTLGVVADLTVTSEGRVGLLDGDLEACRDKIGAILQTAARTTAGYIELSAPTTQPIVRRRQLAEVIEALSAATSTRPGHRAGSMDDLGIPNPDIDLQVAVSAWRRSVEHYITPHVAVTSPRVLYVVAIEAAFTSRSVAAAFSAAAEAEAIDPGAGAHAATSFATAGTKWQRTAAQWHHLRGAASPPAEHLAVAATLRAAITERFHSPQGWMSGRELAAGRGLAELSELAAEARWVSAQLSAAVAPTADVTRSLVEHGAVLVPREAVKEVIARAHGGSRLARLEVPRWPYVPVPPGVTVPLVQDLLSATESAVDATKRAVGAGQVTARLSSPEWLPGAQYAAAVGRRPAGYFAAHPGVAASFPAPNEHTAEPSATTKPSAAPLSGRPAPEIER